MGCFFWVLFHGLDRKKDEMNALDAKHNELESKRALAASGHGEKSVGEVRAGS